MKLIDDYCKSLEINDVLSFNSLRLYKTDIRDFKEFIVGNYGLHFDILQLSELDLKKFMTALLNLGKSTAAINRKLTAVRGFWNWLKEKGLVNRDPFTQIKRDTQFRNIKLATLSEDDIVILLDCPDLDLKAKIILELIYATGIRVSELVNLTVADLDLENNLLTIPSSVKFKERTIPFNQLLASYLLQYIEEENLEAKNKLLLNIKAEKISEREVFRIISEAGQIANLKETVTPSILRNSFLKHMKENGAHDTLLNDLTGQKSVKI
jgi:integrase/recombinase XerD